ncbi:MAG: glycine zipper 2TM domain-containing protein [Burkholderiaceae bacterium]|nr:glycine zipper 2TM domain-containing protein [Burkholderiaceae bacterium]
MRTRPNLSRLALLTGCAIAIAALSGCATQSSSSAVYKSSDTQREQTVRMATVEAVRKVMIQRDSKGIGVVGGAVVGGIAGSTAGKGKGADIGTVLGAIGGMVAGQAIENQANQREGLEITVKYDNGDTRIIVQEADVDVRPGDRVRIVSGGGVTRVSK